MTEADSISIARDCIHRAFGRDDYEYAVDLGRLTIELMAAHQITDSSKIGLWVNEKRQCFDMATVSMPDGREIDVALSREGHS